MDFIPITPKDIPLLKTYLQTQTYRSCDYTVNTIFMWSDYFRYRYTISNDCVVFRGTTQEGYDVFAFPIGRCQVKQTLLDLWECCQKNQEPLRFMTVPKEALDILIEVFQSENLVITPVRKWFDYVYDVTSLATLTGKKNRRHRNQVNKFERLYPAYHFRLIQNDEDIGKVKAFLIEFMEQQAAKNETGDYELTQLNEAFDHFFTLGYRGAYLEVDQKVVAITYGDVIGDTLFVHVEKALRSYEGAYATINHLFAKQHQHLVTYVNREDDLDDPGLRYAKESYHPVMMIEKFNVDVIKK